jgi:hypothetical protein
MVNCKEKLNLIVALSLKLAGKSYGALNTAIRVNILKLAKVLALSAYCSKDTTK